MRDVDVVVLSRFPEIVDGFRNCADADAPELSKICVWDNPKEIPETDPHWLHVAVERPFQMAVNANIGWKQSVKDLIYCGDDTRIIEPDTISRLQALAYSDPKIGILSPRIAGNCAGQPAEFDGLFAEVDFVGFVFCYIKREVIESVGYLDERFEGYGTEDIDFCYRTRLAGFKVAIARDVKVKHGVDGHAYGSTFIRVKGEQQMAKEDAENRRRFAEKWGLDPNDTSGIFAAIRNLSATVSR